MIRDCAGGGVRGFKRRTYSSIGVEWPGPKARVPRLRRFGSAVRFTAGIKLADFECRLGNRVRKVKQKTRLSKLSHGTQRKVRYHVVRPD